MAEAVYILCTLTSTSCAWLLFRGYRQRGLRFLLFSALCFLGLTLNNIVLFYDKIIVPAAVDLSLPRVAIGLFSVCLMVFAFVWET